jgi:hypothetical protein
MWVTNKKLDLSTHVGHEALSANFIVPSFSLVLL